MYGQPPPKNAPDLSFAELLQFAMEKGLGCPEQAVYKIWSSRTLAHAANGRFSTEAVKKWRNGDALPRNEYAAALFDVLTRDELHALEWRACLSFACSIEKGRERNHKTEEKQQFFLRGYKPATVDPRIAVFSISDSGQGIKGGHSIAALLQLGLRPIHHEKGYAYGFRKVYIRLSTTPEVDFEIGDRLGETREAPVGRAKLRASGNAFFPEWEIESEDEFFKGEYSTKDAPLFKLNNAKQGDKMFAQLEAQLFDGSLACSNETAFTSKEKKKIIEILMAKKIAPVENGWIQLCMQILKVESDGSK